MSINVSQAFKRTSIAPIDETMALTKAQMLTVQDTMMPAYYFTICQDDGKIYLYDKSATASATTGKFTEFSGGGSSDVKFFTTTDTLNKDINGTKVVVAADLPGVTWSDLVVGSSVVKDAKGTMGLVTAITGTTDVTVTTATTSTPVKELTQAQYDALSAADKNNGTIYMVTDAQILPGARQTNYSTSEQVVGQWIDGKPIYQKTYITTTPSVANSNEDVCPLGVTVDELVSLDGIVTLVSSDNKFRYPVNNAIGVGTTFAGDYRACWLRPTTIAMNVSSQCTNLTVHITIRYTKA